MSSLLSSSSPGAEQPTVFPTDGEQLTSRKPTSLRGLKNVQYLFQQYVSEANILTSDTKPDRLTGTLYDPEFASKVALLRIVGTFVNNSDKTYEKLFNEFTKVSIKADQIEKYAMIMYAGGKKMYGIESVVTARNLFNPSTNSAEAVNINVVDVSLPISIDEPKEANPRFVVLWNNYHAPFETQLQLDDVTSKVEKFGRKVRTFEERLNTIAESKEELNDICSRINENANVQNKLIADGTDLLKKLEANSAQDAETQASLVALRKDVDALSAKVDGFHDDKQWFLNRLKSHETARIADNETYLRDRNIALGALAVVVLYHVLKPN